MGTSSEGFDDQHHICSNMSFMYQQIHAGFLLEIRQTLYKVESHYATSEMTWLMQIIYNVKLLHPMNGTWRRCKDIQ